MSALDNKKVVGVERLNDTFTNQKGDVVEYTKYYIVVDGISVEIKLDKTGQQLVDRLLK